MNTSVKISKTKKRLSMIAAVTGSVAIIATAIAFVTVDFNGFIMTSSFTMDDSAITALEPIRSDPRSDQNGSGDSGDNGENGSNGNNGSGDNNGQGGQGGLIENASNQNDNDGNGNNNSIADHGLPCLDPNCPIHHPETAAGEHQIPCDDPNCPICTHEPCDDHGLPCDDPNCPIHHPETANKPPVDISMEILRFKPNLSEYVDDDEANAILAEYLDSINQYFEVYPDGKIYLVGCIAKTASWSLTEIDLSYSRAEKVKQSLVELGIAEDKLITIGIGISDPWREDEWADGYFNEEVAKTNRRVWVIPDQYSEQVDMIIAIDEMLDSLESDEQ